ncbi:MAG: DUF1553 domain-containing protein [Phycisphaerae bacterium]|nr:DUF1553 domain-containing protein [Phycisphaerae bacterium]
MVKRFGSAALLWLLIGVATALAAQPFDGSPVGAPKTEIDKLVFGRLEQAGIPPANLCSDAVFVRRAFLDIIGTLPTADEAQSFIADEHADKRSALIDRLLARGEFVDYWTMKWGDVLRVKAEFPINLWPNAVQAYDYWIRTSIRDNMPYDRFVRQMLTSSGSNFRVGQVNFYRAVQSQEPQSLAQAVALTFMGVRADKWPKEQLDGMAAFFSQIDFKPSGEWKEEIVRFDPDKTTGEARAALPAGVFPDGSRARFSPSRDPREMFADWLIDPENPWFTRNIVNRVWAWLLGRGIIHEPDDIRPDNPPSNPELLALLEKELIAAKYDLKHLYRLILNSQTYQLSSIAASDKPEAEVLFAHYPLRRLEAEVLIDALNQITGTTEKYSSAVPEPFTFIPEEQRSIELADGSITSSFLEMFGRSSRDTGLVGERNNNPSAAQRLHMLNSSHIQRKIEQGPRMRALAQSKKTTRVVIDEIYLTILSRFPTDAERKTVETYAQSAASRRDAAVDLAWALINSAEFLYRH